MAVSSGASIRASIRALNFLSSSSPARSYLRQGAPSRADACFIRPRPVPLRRPFYFKKERKKERKKFKTTFCNFLQKPKPVATSLGPPKKALEVITQMGA